eukprot:365675-Chlamydomonas_euryale.AAC.5
MAKVVASVSAAMRLGFLRCALLRVRMIRLVRKWCASVRAGAHERGARTSRWTLLSWGLPRAAHARKPANVRVTVFRVTLPRRARTEPGSGTPARPSSLQLAHRCNRLLVSNCSSGQRRAPSRGRAAHFVDRVDVTAARETTTSLLSRSGASTTNSRPRP